jgi:hypothetical protein
MNALKSIFMVGVGALSALYLANIGVGVVEFMNVFSPNQALQATAVKRLGWQVGRQRPAVPELIR